MSQKEWSKSFLSDVIKVHSLTNAEAEIIASGSFIDDLIRKFTMALFSFSQSSSEITDTRFSKLPNKRLSDSVSLGKDKNSNFEMIDIATKFAS